MSEQQNEKLENYRPESPEATFDLSDNNKKDLPQSAPIEKTQKERSSLSKSGSRKRRKTPDDQGKIKVEQEEAKTVRSSGQTEDEKLKKLKRDEELRMKRLEFRENGKVQMLDKNFVTHLSEMHPTSALHELCTKLNWSPPNLSIAFECGPPMYRLFIFKACVNGHTFQPAIAVDNKKDAKANAAWFALQEMGFVNKDPENPL